MLRSVSPVRALSKAIRPSGHPGRGGDHAGSVSGNALSVIWVAPPVPSEALNMISRSVPPSARTTYAIRVASGDHAGVVSAAGVSVTCRRSLPSMDIVQTSPSWMNARRVPSGETAGLVLAPSVVSRTSLEPSGFIE